MIDMTSAFLKSQVGKTVNCKLLSSPMLDLRQDGKYMAPCRSILLSLVSLKSLWQRW